jgi:hypothetical protein
VLASTTAVQLRPQQFHVRNLVQVFRHPDIGADQIEQFHLLGIGFGAQNQADGRLLACRPFVLVQPAQIQLHLALVGRLKLLQLQFHGHQPPQMPVVEQQIEIKIVGAHADALLPGNKTEACAQFQQKAFHVAQDRRFQIALAVAIGQSEKIQHVGIAKHQIGVICPPARSF